MKHLGQKVVSREEARRFREELRAKGKRVGFTSGTFDLLHPGHVSYLAAARAECDALIVGVNSDYSVKIYKDPARPVCPEADRAVVVAALESVDRAFVFDELNNNKNIEILKPDLYLKAADYTEAKLSSKPLVESYGGKVKLVPQREGYSTTGVLARIVELATPSAAEIRLPPPASAPAVFVDRDGTIIEHVEYLHEPEKLKLLPGAAEGLKRLKAAGYRIVIVTNQPGIGLGYFTREDFFKVNKALLRAASAAGVEIDKIYFCPHGKADKCPCRKPSAALVERAVADLNLNLGASFVIGDMTSDVALAQRAGCRSVLVMTGQAGKDGLFDVKADIVAADLKDAAGRILAAGSAAKAKSAPAPAAGASFVAEEEARRASLEAMGKLGAKLGHDFNNLLGSVRGCVDLMRSKLEKLFPGENPLARQLRIIEGAVSKGLELTTRIRSFVRPGPIETESLHLSACINSVAESLRASGPPERSPEVVVNVISDPLVCANEFLVTQMLTSLALNSIDAMQREVERYIVFHLDEVRAEKDGEGIKAGRAYARISLVDHGKGMKAEVKKNLSEPFFTTSGGGVGRGLGLTFPMASEIMKKHGGLLEVQSMPECGTVVRLYFPLG